MHMTGARDVPSAHLLDQYASVPGKPKQARGCFNCDHWTKRQTELGTIPHCEKLDCYTGRYAGGMCSEHERRKGTDEGYRIL